MTKRIYIDDIEYAIDDVLEMDYGITDSGWSVAIDEHGEPYIHVFDQVEDDGKDDGGGCETSPDLLIMRNLSEYTEKLRNDYSNTASEIPGIQIEEIGPLPSVLFSEEATIHYMSDGSIVTRGEGID